jgi:hypothetical protein
MVRPHPFWRAGALIGLVAVAAVAATQFGLDVIRYRTHSQGMHSPVERQSFFVLQSEADFQRYWQLSQGQPPQTAPRDIDWNRELLIAVHLGQRRTGGHTVQVASIRRERSHELVVDVVERTPPAGQAVAQMLTSPWVLVRMERAAGNFSFRMRMEETRLPINIIGGPPPIGSCVCLCSCCRAQKCHGRGE